MHLHVFANSGKADMGGSGHYERGKQLFCGFWWCTPFCALLMQFPSVTEKFIKICKGVVPHYLLPSYHEIQ